MLLVRTMQRDRPTTQALCEFLLVLLVRVMQSTCIWPQNRRGKSSIPVARHWPFAIDQRCSKHHKTAIYQGKHYQIAYKTKTLSSLFSA